MVPNSEEITSTADDDKRITKLGKYLRKYKLDELPQIINILKGEMSLVGWRPEVLKYRQTLTDEILETKPGLTGIASLWNYNEGATLNKNDPDKDYEERILPKKRELELWYVRHKNLKLDLIILWRTIRKFAGG